MDLTHARRMLEHLKRQKVPGIRMATRKKLSSEDIEALIYSMALILRTRCTKDSHRFIRKLELMNAGFRIATINRCLRSAEMVAGIAEIPKPKLTVIQGGKNE